VAPTSTESPMIYGAKINAGNLTVLLGFDLQSSDSDKRVSDKYAHTKNAMRH
jgi:hypothetical protein